MGENVVIGLSATVPWFAGSVSDATLCPLPLPSCTGVRRPAPGSDL